MTLEIVAIVAALQTWFVVCPLVMGLMGWWIERAPDATATKARFAERLAKVS